MQDHPVVRAAMEDPTGLSGHQLYGLETDFNFVKGMVKERDAMAHKVSEPYAVRRACASQARVEWGRAIGISVLNSSSMGSSPGADTHFHLVLCGCLHPMPQVLSEAHLRRTLGVGSLQAALRPVEEEEQDKPRKLKVEVLYAESRLPRDFSEPCSLCERRSVLETKSMLAH
jgi:hypothetical protein